MVLFIVPATILNFSEPDLDFSLTFEILPKYPTVSSDQLALTQQSSRRDLFVTLSRKLENGMTPLIKKMTLTRDSVFITQ